MLNVRANTLEGRTTSILGMLVEIEGLSDHATVADRFCLQTRNGTALTAEVIGFQRGITQAMVFSAIGALGPGCVATMCAHSRFAECGLAVTNDWIGRVIDPLGRPLDQRGALPSGSHRRQLRISAPEPIQRARLGDRLNLGVRAMDIFCTCRAGQRLGLFAGAGVGKSTLLSMLARYADCDIIVVALIGERGREVREFIEDNLGADGIARSIVVVATSDQPPLMRREAAYAAMTVAEYFRDDGKKVLLLMDSITRFCHALREISLSRGEPPAARGYPPSVFAELPRLLERAGPGVPLNGRAGYITGLFSVLVEGDDNSEPVADAVRGILDGHVILDRSVGERGRYPAVDVLKSLSRSVPGCNSDEENDLTQRARAAMALHEEMTDLIRLGAYRAGTDTNIDTAIRISTAVNGVLTQRYDQYDDISGGFSKLKSAILSST